MKFYQEDLRTAYGKALVDLGREYQNVIVLDADLKTSTMTSLFADAYPKRFIQCGIAEANMMGIAAGLSHLGYVTFPTTFAAFIIRKALDSFYMHACLHNSSVKAVGAYALLRSTLVVCAHSAVKNKNLYFYAQFQRISAHRGKKRAYVAIAHSILIAIYHVLKDNVPFRDLGAEYYSEPA